VTLAGWQKRLLQVAGSAALIVGIFWFVPFSEVVVALRTLDVRYVAAAFAVNLFIAYFESIQLWLLLRRAEMKIGTWKIFETKMVTRFYGQFLPSELMAAAFKFYRLAGPTKQWGEVAAALAFFRVVNMLTLVLLGIVFWAIEIPTGPGRWVGILLIVMALGIFGVHLMISTNSMTRIARGMHSTRMFAWIQGSVVEKAKGFIRTVQGSYQLFRNLLWPIAGLALIRHGLGILGFALLAMSLHVHLSFLTIGWVRVVIQGLMMLPISLSGIGVREGSLVLLLQEYDVEASDAVALAFIMFAVNIVVNSLGGVLELANFLWPKRSEVPAGSGVE
jgi:uncharacterized protein (TIRG00374 family)